jgi:hypothetical protein
MKKQDFLPHSDKALLEWVIAFLLNLFPSLARFLFPDAVYQELAVKRDVYSEKLAIAENPMTRTKGTVQDKNDARKDLEQAVRQAVRQYLTYNTAVTDKDRDDLGLPIHKTTRTPVPKPTTRLEATVKPTGPAEVTIWFRDENETGKAKPTGVHGAETAWAILETPPTDWTQLTHSAFDTNSPLVLTFTGEERGKTLYFALRWENTRGEKGPWNEIMSAVIP